MTDGTLITFPINLVILGASGQSALSIGSSTWKKMTISNELSLTKYENFRGQDTLHSFVMRRRSSLLSVVISGSGIKYVKCIRCGFPSGMLLSPIPLCISQLLTPFLHFARRHIQSTTWKQAFFFDTRL